MRFRAESKKMQEKINEMEGIQKKLQQYQQELDQLASSLDFQLRYREQIIGKIRSVSEELKEETGIALTMKTSLETIEALYRKTEERVKGKCPQKTFSFIGKEEIPQEAVDFLKTVDWEKMDYSRVLRDLMLILGGRWEYVAVENLIRRYQLWYDQKMVEVERWVESVEDEKTRNYLREHMAYTDNIMDAYDKAEGTAKELYDKYKDKIKIASMEEEGSYCSGDQLYINYEGDIDDPRGSESIYYHESGHWIVHENGWINDQGEISPEFARFDQAVKEDVGNYIAQIEQGFRDEVSPLVPEFMREQAVRIATQKYLEETLGGDNFHVLDGVSDMIDASSNGKYKITYGHDDGYWDEWPSRQANEAFAEMFSADICGDTVETDFMKKHFPNAYREYENLKNSALNG
ncbi:MAG: hypothetical protein ACOX8H_12530 [Ruminococcus sp.]